MERKAGGEGKCSNTRHPEQLARASDEGLGGGGKGDLAGGHSVKHEALHVIRDGRARARAARGMPCARKPRIRPGVSC